VTVPIFVAAVLIYAAAAAQDLRQRKVSNYFCAGIAILGVVRWLMLLQLWPSVFALMAAIVLFAIGSFFFARGWLGGGDVKLIAATSLLIGAGDTPPFLLLMSLIGSGLSLVILVHLGLRRWSATADRSAAADVSNAEAIAPADRFRVPYGVAVSVAASVVVFIQMQGA
jgi:prepilin peptidase CpaA